MDAVTIERLDGGVALVRLNRPDKRNALSVEIVEGLLARLTEAFDDDAVRVSSTAEASAPRARIVALRDVAAGEELTHAYVDVTRPAEVRAAALAGFGFKCGCERCARARGG